MLFILVGLNHRILARTWLLTDYHRFPSHQTWFLVICLVLFTWVRPSVVVFVPIINNLNHSSTEWIASLVLSTLIFFTLWFWIRHDIKLTDIGLPAYQSIPKGQRVVGSVFQGLAARASGFAIFPLASFAPALQWASFHASVETIHLS